MTVSRLPIPPEPDPTQLDALMRLAAVADRLERLTERWTAATDRFAESLKEDQ